MLSAICMQEWPAGSLEETVQNVIKTWEMELSHKARLSDFKSVSPGRFSLSVNGGPAWTGEQTLAVGSYNVLLASPMLASTGAYNAAKETFKSSHDLFRSAFPRGFAWEVLKVYSGPPVIVFKFRHWGHMEGPYNGHATTGEKVEFHGVAVLKVRTRERCTPNIYIIPFCSVDSSIKCPISGQYYVETCDRTRRRKISHHY
jgi:hypothetical protein